MPVHIDEIHTEVETRGAGVSEAKDAGGDPRWPQQDRARKHRRDERWRSERVRAEGRDD